MPVPRPRRARPGPPARPGGRRWPRRTARLRLTALYGGLFLASGAALVAVTYVLFQQATRYRPPRLPTVPRTPALNALEHLLPLSGIFQPLAKAQYQLNQFASPPTGVAPGQLPKFVGLSTLKKRLAQAHYHLALAQHQLANAVHQVARTGSVRAAQRATDSHQLLLNSGIALALVAVLALVVGWLVAGRVLRPIRTITGTARRISSASLHERLALEGPADELKELGDTLDDLFGRLEAAFEAQRHFVANASHELRTPLAAERNLLQVALDDPRTSAGAWRSTAEELLASNDEQSHLIESLLTLASSEVGLDHHEPLDLGDTVDSVVGQRCGAAARRRLHVDTAIAPAPIDGDPHLVDSLVANLVDNAITHNVEGGRIAITTGAEGTSAVLRVANSGPPISAADVDRLFQPFQRLDRRRLHHANGHGLGLSIVRAIAQAHGGQISANPLPTGGITIEVALPLRSAAAAVPLGSGALVGPAGPRVPTS